MNLNPSGATASAANATTGTLQAGQAVIGGVDRAGIWSGTASSFTDLQTILGSAYTSSDAFGIWTTGTTTYVSGDANTTAGKTDAILWTITVPKPSPTMLIFGAGMMLPLWSRRRR